jgi:putative ABC transport system permease protein
MPRHYTSSDVAHPSHDNDNDMISESLPSPRPSASAARDGAIGLWWHDLGSALRGLVHSPRYTLPALLSLALGLGAAISVFSVFSALVLRPLPFAREAELVRIGTAREGGGGDPERVAGPFVRDFRALTDVFAALAPYRQLGGRMDTPNGPHEFSPTLTASNFFDTLVVQPEQGRVYTAQGVAPDAGDVIVLRHGYWLEAFGGAPIVGQPVRVNDESKTVIGILPDDQALPTWADAWMPSEQAALVGERFQPLGSAIARLRPGVSLEQARERLDALAQSAQHRDRTGAIIGGQLTPLRDALIGARNSSLALLVGAVLAFLLLACANLAALLGTRAAVRQRELALRAALGASRAVLLRQSAFEAALLVLLGGPLALGLALPCIQLAARDYPELLGNAPPRLDARVLGAFFGLLALTTLVGSLAPALRTRKLRPMEVLRGEGRGSQSRAARRLREVLLAVQVAATLALLINAGLLIRSMRALLAVEPGWQTDFGMSAVVVMPTLRREPGEAGSLAQRDDARQRLGVLYERLRSLPGAQSTCLAAELPFDRITNVLEVEGDLAPLEPARSVRRHHVGPGCFSTLGIPLLSGRDFTPQDGFESPPAIVNRSFAQKLLRGEDPVGRRLRIAAPPGYSGELAPWLEIIGMVDDALERDLTETSSPAMYVPFLGEPRVWGNESSVGFVVAVRPRGDVAPYLTSLPRFLREVLPSAAINEVELSHDRIDRSLGERSALGRVLTAFGAAALVLAAIGLFGVTGYTVAERSPEIGIRRALGASRGRILGLVLGETAAVVALGMLAGLLLTWLGRGFLRTFLFQTGAVDPLTYASVCFGIFAVALLAALAPALAAAQISPSRALAER